MSETRRFFAREDLLLILASVLLGGAVAAAYGAFRAVSISDEDVSGRMVEFASNVLWPGALIFLGVAVTVIVGWKANLD